MHTFPRGALVLLALLLLSGCVSRSTTTPAAETTTAPVETEAASTVTPFESTTPTNDPNAKAPYLQLGTKWSDTEEPWFHSFVVPETGACYGEIGGHNYTLQFSERENTVDFFIGFLAAYDGEVLLWERALSATYTYTADTCILTITEDAFGMLDEPLPTYTMTRGAVTDATMRANARFITSFLPTVQPDTAWQYYSTDSSKLVILTVDAARNCKMKVLQNTGDGRITSEYDVLWNFGGHDFVMVTATETDGQITYTPFLYGLAYPDYTNDWFATCTTTCYVTKAADDAPFAVDDVWSLQRYEVDRPLHLGELMESIERSCQEKGAQLVTCETVPGLHFLYTAETITLLYEGYSYDSNPTGGALRFVQAYATYDRETGALRTCEGTCPLDTAFAKQYQMTNTSYFAAQCGYYGLDVNEDGHLYFLDTCGFVIWEEMHEGRACDVSYDVILPSDFES